MKFRVRIVGIDWHYRISPLLKNFSISEHATKLSFRISYRHNKKSKEMCAFLHRPVYKICPDESWGDEEPFYQIEDHFWERESAFIWYGSRPFYWFKITNRRNVWLEDCI